MRDLATFLSKAIKPGLVVGCGWNVDKTQWATKPPHQPEMVHPRDQFYCIDSDESTGPDAVGGFAKLDLSVGYGQFTQVWFEYMCTFEHNRKVKFDFETMLPIADNLLAPGGILRFLSADGGERGKAEGIMKTLNYEKVTRDGWQYMGHAVDHQVHGTKPGAPRVDDTRCFVATATCVTLGLPDDCEELATLRWYRDTVLLQDPQGRRDVEAYYARAPSIIAAINASPDAAAIYGGIYLDAVRPAIEAIQRGDFAGAYAIARAAMDDMERRFPLAGRS